MAKNRWERFAGAPKIIEEFTEEVPKKAYIQYRIGLRTGFWGRYQIKLSTHVSSNILFPNLSTISVRYNHLGLYGENKIETIWIINKDDY